MSLDRLMMEGVSEYPLESSLKQIAGPNSEYSDSVDLGQGLKICISNKFSGAVGAVPPGTIV